uniref:Uncharacterized protein n=1 Tax=Brassica campestris TaxID=3711 RepID=M4EYA5_BRACM
MVSSQIADYPEEDDGDGGLPIPKMMFAAGEELGLGFLTYFKLSRGRRNPYITQVTIHTKQKDDVSLSQNTIAVKGFALALQLVMVEAVPSLTEVVLQTFSSSESDSCDEDDDFLHKKMKKQTLSHGHAREVDQKTEVFDLSPTFQFLYIRSIIPEDPDRPIEAGTLVWADEVVDVEVDNLVKLITQNHSFNSEMFKGPARFTVNQWHSACIDRCLTLNVDLQAGLMRVLDIQLAKEHQKVTLYVGSKKEMKKLDDVFEDSRCKIRI